MAVEVRGLVAATGWAVSGLVVVAVVVVAAGSSLAVAVVAEEEAMVEAVAVAAMEAQEGAR